MVLDSARSNKRNIHPILVTNPETDERPEVRQGIRGTTIYSSWVQGQEKYERKQEPPKTLVKHTKAQKVHGRQVVAAPLSTFPIIVIDGQAIHQPYSRIQSTSPSEIRNNQTVTPLTTEREDDIRRDSI